ncbi:MAG: UvrD-helicase domain-containing protein [Planctomycetota bacterium]|nr:UvrD-helicase domain-containing protein [Planctomycetota bacterium]
MLHQLRVSTMDSLFAQIVTASAWELRLPAGWRLAEEFEAHRLRDASIMDVLSGEATKDISRILQLIRRGDSSQFVHRDLRKTVSELHSAFRQGDPECWTFVQPQRTLSPTEKLEFVQRLRSVPLSNSVKLNSAREKDCQRFENEEWTEFVKFGISAKVVAGESKYSRIDIPAELIEAYLPLIKHVRSAVLTEIATQTAATFELMQKYDTAFRRQQRMSRIYRFEDIVDILKTVRESPDSLIQGFQLEYSIDHLLLDEFQDTSLDQWDILLPLAERIVAGPSVQRPGKLASSLFCVGDVKQSIYGWRGGEPQILANLSRQLPLIRVTELNQSRRSSPVIIATVNRLFTGMRQHADLEQYEEPVREWCDSFPVHGTAISDSPGYAELRTGGDGSGDASTLPVAAELVAAYVNRGIHRSIAVLVRNNSGVTHMADELRRLGISVSEEGGTTLYDAPGVTLLLSFFRWLDHPDDGPSRFHLSNSVLAGNLRLNEGTIAFAVASGYRRRLLEEGYGAVVLELARLLAPQFTAQERLRLQQLVGLAFSYEPHATLRPRDFLRFVEAQRVAESVVASVRVMTIHQSKGLEFDAVVLPQLHEKLARASDPCIVGRDESTGPVRRISVSRSRELSPLLPVPLQRDYAMQLRQETQEALCTLYVATTRARHALHLVVPPAASAEKQLSKTIGGLVRASLVGATPIHQWNEIVWSDGDARWYESGMLPPIAEPAVTVRLPRTINFAKEVARPHVWVRPSEMTGHTRSLGRDRLRGKSSEAAQLGTLLHAWFERIDWLEDGIPGPEVWYEISTALGYPSDVVERAKSQSQDLLVNPSVANLFRRSTYEHAPDALPDQVLANSTKAAWEVELWREQRFAVRDDNRFISGIIDRVVVTCGTDGPVAAEVIDFKSDAIENEQQLVQKETRYRSQMDAYRFAVQRLCGLRSDQVTTKLLFLSCGKVLLVPGPVDEDPRSGRNPVPDSKTTPRLTTTQLGLPFEED